MMYLLERDACEAWVRGVGPVRNRFVQNQGNLYTSAVTLMALEIWFLNPRTPNRYTQGYAGIIRQVKVVNVDEPVAHRAAVLTSRHSGQKPRLTAFDFLVAATALEHGMTLVTHDVQHYSPVPGLVIVDWRIP